MPNVTINREIVQAIRLRLGELENLAAHRGVMSKRRQLLLAQIDHALDAQPIVMHEADGIRHELATDAAHFAQQVDDRREKLRGLGMSEEQIDNPRPIVFLACPECREVTGWTYPHLVSRKPPSFCERCHPAAALWHDHLWSFAHDDREPRQGITSPEPAPPGVDAKAQPGRAYWCKRQELEPLDPCADARAAAVRGLEINEDREELRALLSKVAAATSYSTAGALLHPFKSVTSIPPEHFDTIRERAQLILRSPAGGQRVVVELAFAQNLSREDLPVRIEDAGDFLRLLDAAKLRVIR